MGYSSSRMNSSGYVLLIIIKTSLQDEKIKTGWGPKRFPQPAD